MVPTLALGIPGSATTAVILTGLIIHGVRPGPDLFREQPDFLYGIFGAMLIAKNLATREGGLFDPEATGGPNGKNWSHLTTSYPTNHYLFCIQLFQQL